MGRWSTIAACGVAGLALAAGLVAEARAETTFGFHGELRQRYIRLTEAPLDGAGTHHGQPYRDTLRLHVRSQMNFTRSFYLRTNLELLDGQVLGPTGAVHGGRGGARWRNADIVDHFFLRESILQVPIGIGFVRAGRMPVHWGLGLVVNDGEREDSWFADATGGDIVNGGWIEVQPLFPFTQGRLGQAVRLGIGGDVVERDELAIREAGDLAWRITAALSWEEPSLNAGVFMMIRDVLRDGGDHATHLAFDAAADWRIRFGRTFKLRVAGELAVVTGTSNTTPTVGTRVESTIQQLGGVARAELEDRVRHLEYGVELGFATGDDDPFDGTDTAFRFDPSYNVGMILFDDVLGRATARSWDKLVAVSGGTWATEHPDLLPSGGSVFNAVYVAPRVRWTVCDGCFTASAGGLLAFAPEPLVDATSKAVDGTTSLNPWGGEASAGPLGYELNAGAEVAFHLAEVVRFAVGTQYGFFVPGEALEADPDAVALGTVHKWRLTADLDW